MAKKTYVAKKTYDLRGIGGLGEGSEVTITGEPTGAHDQTAAIGMHVVANICGRENSMQHSLELEADPELGRVGDTYVNRHLLGILATSAAYDAFRGLHTGGSKIWEREIHALETFFGNCLKTETGINPANYSSYRG